MAEPRRASLLDFAIAASLAVVPMLLGVVLLVESGRREPAGDSHVSARQLAALRTFEEGIVGRHAGIAAPGAQTLLEGLPQCAAEWRGRSGAAGWWRVLAGQGDDGRAPVHRVVADLAALDSALARMSAAGNRRIADPVALDTGRWLRAAQRALDTPVESARYPGRSFHVRCEDLAAAARLLARDDGRVLPALAWRGTEVDRATAQWRDDQHVAIAARHLARSNPWAGLPGCVFLGRGDATPTHFVLPGRAGERACAQPRVFERDPASTDRSPAGIAGEPRLDEPPDSERWRVPPSLAALLQPLDPLRRPAGVRFAAYAGTPESADFPQRIAFDGAPVDLGFSVDLSIDPDLQALAQRIATCYTGRQDVCRWLQVTREEDPKRAVGHRLLEQAMVRMAAIAIVDVGSGRIEALAGSLSRCARQEVDGPGRDAGCDARLPYPVRYRPDALLNPAVFHDAMPASVVKPVMAAAFLSDAGVGPRWLAAERAAMTRSQPPAADSLRGQLMRSDSARFLDRMFCADRGFADCGRVWEVQAITGAFGWNQGCEATSERCGARDLLFGRSPANETDAPAAWIPFGRLLVEPERIPASGFRTRSAVALDTGRIARCAAGPDGVRRTKDDWAHCRGAMIVDVVAEGWGQGHARSTALGVAGMMATLAAAANGQVAAHRPHLVRDVRALADADLPAMREAVERWRASANEGHGLVREAAEVVLDGLSFSHRQGTARRACEQVLGAAACRQATWIAGKTGTPTFPNDDRSLDELARLCVAGSTRTRDEQAACGALRPYKWYVAAYRSDPSQPGWDKAIGVLAERNWLADTGRIHGAGDHGPNPAAEIAFQIVARQVGAWKGAHP